MMDLLWSDPTEDDTQQGIQANLRRGQVGLTVPIQWSRTVSTRALLHPVEWVH